MRYSFVGKYFVVRLSTTKTTKILPHEKYPLYGIYELLPVPCHLISVLWADTVLIGQQFPQEFTATHYFRRGATSTRICLPSSSRDNQVCESDTIGTIRLINSSAVRVMEPYIATVTITDDEREGPTAMCFH